MNMIVFSTSHGCHFDFGLNSKKGGFIISLEASENCLLTADALGKYFLCRKWRRKGIMLCFQGVKSERSLQATHLFTHLGPA